MRAHDEMASAGDWPEHIDGNHRAKAAGVLRQLADPTRLHLLWLLADGPLDVSSLASQVDASRSSVSQHLSRLRLTGLVQADRDGRHMLYRLTNEHVRLLVAEAYRIVDHLRELSHQR
jgi:DNA-binding transcriptional ArsR family regulator